MTTFELAADQMKGLRCSWPPYFVGTMTPAGWPVAAMSGDSYEILERGLAPTAEEAKVTLIRLRQKLRWSRPMLAAFLGVSRDVVRSWESGQRNPSGAARRLIWLLDLLAHEPHKLKSAMDLVFWGKGKECKNGFRHLAGRKVPKKGKTMPTRKAPLPKTHCD